MSISNSRVLSLRELSLEAYVNANPLHERVPDLKFLTVDLIKDQWENLKENAPRGPLDIPKIMGTIEKEYRHSQVNVFFYCLQNKLQADFDRAGISQRSELLVTPSELVELQDRLQAIEENRALELIWERISPHFQFNGDGPVGHQEIRVWLNNPAHEEMINGVQELDLVGLDLKVLPKEISRFLGLTSLNLEHNELSSLPESFGALTRLTTLNLSHNRLTSLPKSFGKLSGLTILELNSNRLTNLPESFGALIRLTELRLDNNHLTSLPESFGKLTGLTVLTLNDNRLTSLSESFGKLTGLTELYLDNNHLTSLPESFGKLTSLTSLVLNHNYLRSLPESVGALIGLTMLMLNDNRLTSLPESFGKLTALTMLELHHNRLIKLPESFGKLTALTMLELHHNRLIKLPESFGKLTALTMLELHHNRLIKLPESFGALTSLTRFDLGNNRLTRLPESLFHPEGNHLSLHLEGNRLTSLPNSFRPLTHSSLFWLGGNPLLFISDVELDNHPVLFPRSLLEYTTSCLKYGCTTTPALFLQIILSQALCDDLSDSEKALLKKIFTSFPDTIKDSIKSTVRLLTERELEGSSSSSESSSSAVRDFDLFADLGLLGGAARNVFLAPVLEEQQKAAIHLEVSRLAGQGGNVEWGAEHASDHILRYIDAWSTVLYPHLTNDLSDDMLPLLMRLRKDMAKTELERGASVALHDDLHGSDDHTLMPIEEMEATITRQMAESFRGLLNSGMQLMFNDTPVMAGEEAMIMEIAAQLTRSIMNRESNMELETRAPPEIMHQRRLDASLEAMWNGIQHWFRYSSGAPVIDGPVGAKAIRQWLNDPANAEVISQIEQLPLQGLGLEVIPPEIGHLTQLQWLHLSDNQLATLPPEISNLSQLKGLNLGNNQFITLPPEISNLSQLQQVGLSGNSLIFMQDKDLFERGWAAQLNLSDILAKHTACSNYVCQSSLAALCQALHRGVDDEALREHFEALSPEMQQQIRHRWESTPSSSILDSTPVGPPGGLHGNCGQRRLPRVTGRAFVTGHVLDVNGGMAM